MHKIGVVIWVIEKCFLRSCDAEYLQLRQVEKMRAPMGIDKARHFVCSI